VIFLSRRFRRLAPVLALAVLLVSGFSSCSILGNGGGPDANKVLSIAAVFPTSGPEAGVGQAMKNAVDLAVAQNASLGDGYTLSATNVDEANGFTDQAVETLASNSLTVGIVGPQDSQDAVAMLPTIEASGIATISPTATLPGLTQANLASAESISFTAIHPAGKPLAFFRLPPTDDIAGKVAADLALAPQQSMGLAAHAVFIVDDGTPSGKALAAAFKQELQANQGTVVGQESLTMGVSDNSQPIVSAIVEANPDIVYFAGGIGAGAKLRSTLSLSGAPQLTILASGPIADDPTWGTAVGLPAASADTTGILPAQDLSKLPNTQDFVTAFHTSYPGVSSPPESALAYDAAMDEISAIKSVIHSGKPVTRAAVLATLASSQYSGTTGKISFNQNGDNATTLALSLYTCDSKGNWHYQTSLKS
jgi:branched-chain amino acid transport system substrate-binding protein